MRRKPDWTEFAAAPERLLLVVIVIATNTTTTTPRAISLRFVVKLNMPLHSGPFDRVPRTRVTAEVRSLGRSHRLQQVH